MFMVFSTEICGNVLQSFFSVDGNCTKPVQQFVDPGMFEPFMQLVLKENEAVRQSMADNLSRLFSHVKIFHANGKLKSKAPNNFQ
mgnify:CR=1 FL=1